MSVLQTIAIGRLTDDPEYREVGQGEEKTPLCKFSIAVNLGFGERQTTEYVDCVAWRGLGKMIAEHCKKGRKVFISGVPKKSSYTATKDGVSYRQYSWSVDVKEFEFCDSNNGGNNGGTTRYQEEVPVEDPPF